MQTSKLLIFLGCLISLLLSSPARGQHPTLDQARELHVAGELRPALAAYRAFLEEAGQELPEIAAAHNNACLLLNDLGDFAGALEHCAVAIELWRRSGEPRRLARTLNNSALALQHLGRYDEAQADYVEALAINEQHHDVSAQVINHSNLGLLAAAAGRYGEALAQHLEAEELATSQSSEPWAAAQIRIAWVNQGVVLEKLGAYRRALEVYQRLLPQRDEMPPRQWARALINIGTVYRNLGDPVEAESSYRRAAEIFRSVDDTTGLARARLNLGQVQHLNLGQPAAALQSYSDALDLVGSSGDRSAEVEILFLLANLQLDMSQHDEAHQTFSHCLELAQQAGSAEGSWSAHYGLGRLALRQGELTMATEHFGAGIQVIEETRAELRDRNLRGGFFAERRPVYTAAIEAWWRLHQQGDPQAAARAFNLASRSKERELLSAMGRQPTRANADDLLELRARLGNDSLVEFFLGQEQLFAWILTGDRLTMARIEGAHEIRQLTTRIHRQLSSRQAVDPSAIAALSRSLLYESGLEQALTKPGRLWLAVDGRLRYLPFELLRLPAGEALVDRKTIAYLPSAAALPSPINRSKPRYTLVGLANPELPPRLDEAFAAALLDVMPLPASAEELARAGALLGGRQRLLSGPEATPEALAEYASLGTGVLHIGAHSVIDERPGYGAAVLLAPDDENDGILRPREIAGLALPTELTVLASCSSALGEADDVGALGSLTGAFLVAGSSAVLATLWDVGDQATAVFMGQFYHQLGQGLPPARALVETKRRLRADSRWQAPHLWAGYVLVGDSPPLVPSWRRWRSLIIGSLAVIVCLWLLWLFQQHRPRSRSGSR